MILADYPYSSIFLSQWIEIMHLCVFVFVKQEDFSYNEITGTTKYLCVHIILFKFENANSNRFFFFQNYHKKEALIFFNI